MSDLSSPAQIMRRLEDIENDLASRQNDFEAAALGWFRAKRDREKTEAAAFLQAVGTDAGRRATARREAALIGADEEAAYEAQRAVVKVLETRASIGQSLLRAQARA